MAFVYDANNLCLRCRQKTLLSNVSLGVEQGQCVGFVGPNGAGKSSLFNVLSGVVGVGNVSGKLFFKGRELSSWRAEGLARHRVFLAQEQALHLPFKAGEVVAMGLFPYNILPAERVGILERAAAFSLVAGNLNQDYNSLSGGEKKRVHLARAFAQLSASDEQEKVLLLDEPFSSLDLAHRVHLLRELKSLAKSGTTILVALHDLRLAVELADKVVALSNGKVVEEGSPSKVLSPMRLRKLFDLEESDLSLLGLEKK